jgi:hypothetical protein
MVANNKTKKYKKGGSGLHLSPNFVKSLVDKLKKQSINNRNIPTKKTNMNSNSIIKKQKLMKLNYNLKIRNLTKKKSSSSDYSNVEVVNTTGPEWKVEIGNFKRKEKIPSILLPERKKKGAVFTRISSSMTKY